MLKDAAGNRLFRKVVVRIIFPDAIFPPRVIAQHAGPHQGFGPDGIDNILMSVADKLDELYPWWEFRVVELAPEGRTAKYVFTFAGYRSVKPAAAPVPEFTQEPTTAESTTLGPGPTELSTPAEAGNSVAAPLVQE